MCNSYLVGSFKIMSTGNNLSDTFSFGCYRLNERPVDQTRDSSCVIKSPVRRTCESNVLKCPLVESPSHQDE